VNLPTLRSHGARLLPYTPLLAWFAYSCLLFSRWLAHPTKSVPGGADGILFCWHFEAVQRALWHFDNPLHSVAMNAPEGLNIMWNTSVLGAAIVASPLTATIGPIATVGLMMMLAPVLAATSAYFVLRRLTGHSVIAVLSATFYGFGPFFIGQAGHLHLTFAAPAIPLIFLIGYRIFVTQDGSARLRGIQLATVVIVTMLISEEVVAISAIIAALGVGIAVAINWSQVAAKRNYALTAVGWAAAISVVVLAFPLGYQFFGPNVLSSSIPSYQSMDLASPLRPSLLMRFATDSDVAVNKTFRANDVENTGYLGLAILAVLAVACVLMLRYRRKMGLWWIVTILATMTLSLGATIYVNGTRTVVHGPWSPLSKLPVLGSLVPVRFTLATAFLVSLGIAIGLSTLRNVRLRVAGCVAMALALLTLIPAHRANDMLPMQDSGFFSTSASKSIPDGANTLILPMPGDPNNVAQVMYWQLQNHNRFNIYGGYSVFAVDGELRYIPELPLFARVLSQSALSGYEPDTPTYISARTSLIDEKADVIVLRNTLEHFDVVVRVAEHMTGCQSRQVADVVVCEIPGR